MKSLRIEPINEDYPITIDRIEEALKEIPRDDWELVHIVIEQEEAERQLCELIESSGVIFRVKYSNGRGRVVGYMSNTLNRMVSIIYIEDAVQPSIQIEVKDG